ncbi:MAG: pyridoxamine 5'-phosphate oxidase family protein [Bacteroidia bacterium]|nr:pyridoxamine 5'-phosphate oxidase family protein [Bacteroidia bacterium]NNM15388.1 pyridoxamine 5'-phosphate oxidase family protein [Bacteroidia bacterium]
MANEKSKVKRVPKRGRYDKETIHGILDNNRICHVAFIHQGVPFSIPTIYARDENKIYLHGASVSRMLVELDKGIDMCLSVASVEALVLARSAFHHSMNYHSAVVFGKGKSIEDEKEKLHALKVITEKLVPGRWEDARQPNPIEMKATKVIAIEIEDASAKIRNEGVGDEKEDYDLDVWAGLVPINNDLQAPISDDKLKEGIEIPDYIKKLVEK